MAYRSAHQTSTSSALQTHSTQGDRPPLTQLTTPKNLTVRISSPLLQGPLKYIDNPIFHAPDAHAHIIEAPFPAAVPLRRGRPSRDESSSQTSAGGVLRAMPLLTRDQERYLFLKMNYLKYLAAEKIRAFETETLGPQQAEEAHSLLAQASAVKQHIILANTGLVLKEAALAKVRSLEYDDLVSEGFINLLHSSAEAFDCSRGIKFSTYAVTALKRHYLNQIERHKNWERGLEILGPTAEANIDHRTAAYGDVRNQASFAAFANNLLTLLPQREAQVIRLRFLEDKQLSAISEELGVSKQRASQIIERALNRARSLGLTNPIDDVV
jgi:RNA polymerase sigma factor (sigma-70 family)